MNLLKLVSNIFQPAVELVDSMHTSTEEKLTVKAKLFELQTLLFGKIADYETKLLEAKSTIITAEAKSESWLTANWRPVTMMLFVASILAYWFGLTPDSLTEDNVADMFDLVQLGIGGYVASRGLEKIAEKVTVRMKPE